MTRAPQERRRKPFQMPKTNGTRGLAPYGPNRTLLIRPAGHLAPSLASNRLISQSF